MYRFILWSFRIAMTVLGVGTACGQTAYPNKPIRIVAAEAGGSLDLIARIIADGISGSLGRPVIVDNRCGGMISAGIVANAPPDGYTLVLATGSLWLSPFLRQTSYDPVRDFSPVTLVATSPNVVVVHPATPIASIRELIALAKAKPRELNYGSSAIGSSNQLGAELFNAMAGVTLVGIAYKGNGPALNATISGEIQVMFSTTAPAMPHIKSGRLKALAATSAQPSTLLPGLPTVAATLPGYEMILVAGFLAPGKTPAAITDRLSRETVQFLRRAEVKEKFISVGVEAAGSSPEQFAATIRAEMTRMGKVIKDAGIRAD